MFVLVSELADSFTVSCN